MFDASRPVSEQVSVGSGYQIFVDRGTDAACNSQTPPAGTDIVVQCGACLADPSENQYDCSPGCSEYWPNCCPTAQIGCFP
jgi:hypothetical protein